MSPHFEFEMRSKSDTSSFKTPFSSLISGVELRSCWASLSRVNLSCQMRPGEVGRSAPTLSAPDELTQVTHVRLILCSYR
eukprot:6978098-Prymnesium_polylepis.1